ncbi:hypothetical protein ACHAXS_004100 [Conticribra weissflogii]
MATKRKSRSSTSAKSTSKQPAAKFKKSSNGPSGAGSATESGAATKKNTPRRVRRKCSFPDCPNRVVQGGVCVTHGAKRKLCDVPGCTKAVKIAGRCSSHGPARRKCDFEGCPRVAVQGGKCLSHGARRRVCKWLGTDGKGCNKNAIVGGMCKKHHDLAEEANGLLANLQICMPVDEEPKGIETRISDGRAAAAVESSGAPLERQSAAVQEKAPSSSETDSSLSTLASTASTASTLSLVSMTATKADFEPPTPPGKKREASKTNRNSTSKKHHHQRGLSVFDEMPIVDAIISSSVSKEEALVEEEREESRDDEGIATIRSSDETVDGIIAPVPEFQATVSASNLEGVSSAPIPSGLPPLYPKQPISASPAPPSCLYPTKTPKPQVTFALGPASHAASASMSAALSDDYFSPTLAIFEQMIQASQVVDGKTFSSKLSTPKLSPRIRPPQPESESQDGALIYQDGGIAPAPGSPSSTAVLRKVSSNNIVGQSQGQAPDKVVLENTVYYHYYPTEHAPEPYLPQPQYYQQAYPYGQQPPQQPYQYLPHPLPPPAQNPPYHQPPYEQHHGPRPIPDEDYLSRTVSHDVEDDHNRGYHYSHHLQQPEHHHHQQATVLSPHRRVTIAYSHPVPETPALNDASMDPAVMVSGGSHAGGGKALLPKPRSGELEHLFIP